MILRRFEGGLLVVVAVGISRNYHIGMPLMIYLAGTLELEPGEERAVREIRVIVVDEDAIEQARMTAGFQMSPPPLNPGEAVVVPVAIMVSLLLPRVTSDMIFG